jgi:hypothetical protein
MDLGLYDLSASFESPTFESSMEDFILKEIDYAQENGYSSRSKRLMRRNLHKKFDMYNKSDDSDEMEDIKYHFECQLEKNEKEFKSFIRKSHKIAACIAVSHVIFYVSVYIVALYIDTYSQCVIKI